MFDDAAWKIISKEKKSLRCGIEQACFLKLMMSQRVFHQKEKKNHRYSWSSRVRHEKLLWCCLFSSPSASVTEFIKEKFSISLEETHWDDDIKAPRLESFILPKTKREMKNYARSVSFLISREFHRRRARDTKPRREEKFQKKKSHNKLWLKYYLFEQIASVGGRRRKSIKYTLWWLLLTSHVNCFQAREGKRNFRCHEIRKLVSSVLEMRPG